MAGAEAGCIIAKKEKGIAPLARRTIKKEKILKIKKITGTEMVAPAMKSILGRFRPSYLEANTSCPMG